MIRIVPDESNPMSVDELRSHGNRLLLDAHDAALNAMRASINPAFVIRGNRTAKLPGGGVQ
ncbi:hypothetical protein SEA_FRANKIE_82 [Mycobacterium phage Frankie]|nr:hypothetical protein SEA_FRANKIE_82 [Mycobacterium phage Frankie]